jgi:hypothetical protein
MGMTSTLLGGIGETSHYLFVGTYEFFHTDLALFVEPQTFG